VSCALINGQPSECIVSTDRGLHYGDGVFETISCRRGRPRWLPLHLQRLQRGCECLGLRFQEYALLEHEIGALAAGAERCIVKVIVTRGPATRRGYAPTGQEQSTRLVARYDWPESEPDGSALRVAVSEVRLGTNPMLAGLKHLNRLEQVMAQRARPPSVDEVVMLSASGTVIAGSTSNVFFADDEGLSTPALTECGVEGVMRRLVLQAARDLGIPVKVRPVHPNELGSMREAFMTNVRWGLRSVARLGERALPVDDCARRLRAVIPELN
jgi:4-amino-4-deoxychorismate lyase